MKIVVGLGNPGSRYTGTRHNVGFAVIDRLSGLPGTSRFQERFHSQVAELAGLDEKVLLAKPETFMNLTGQAVRALVDFYQLEPSNLLVVCDDFNLPLGRLRVRTGGSHGGHNGLRNIQEHLGTSAYPRLRIGVGEPQPDQAIDHVLGRFRPSEKPVIEEKIADAAEAVLVWADKGVEQCMNQYNG